MEKKEKKQKSDKEKRRDNLMTGSILLAIGLVFFLILVGVFGAAGDVVKNFFVGTFGYAAYAYMVALMLVGVLIMCGVKRPKMTWVQGIFTILAVGCIIAVLHVVSSSSISSEGYGKYLAECYTMHNTAGGVLGGIFIYPILLINYYFGIILFSLLTIASAGMALFYDGYIKGRIKGRQRAEENESEYNFDGMADIVDNTDSEPIGTGLMYNDNTPSAGKKKPSNKGNSTYKTLDELEEESYQRVNFEGEYDSAEEMERAFNAKANKIFGKKQQENTQNNAQEDDFTRAYRVLYQEHAQGTLASMQSDIDQRKYKSATPEEKKSMEEEFRSYSSTYRKEKVMKNYTDEYNAKNDSVEDNFSSVPNHFEVEEIVLDTPHSEPEASEPELTPVVEPVVEIATDSVSQVLRERLQQAKQTEPKEKVLDVEILDTTDNAQKAEKKPEIEDQTCREEISSFQDLLRKKRLEKEAQEANKTDARHNYQNQKLSDQNAERAEITPDIAPDRKRAERSDKGGTHNTTERPREVASTPTATPSQPTPPKPVAPVVAKPSTNAGASEQEKQKEATRVVTLAPYKAPPVDLLKDYPSAYGIDNIEEKRETLESTLKSFKVDAEVVNIVTGPTFTRFELQMAPGIPVKRVENYIDDIAMALEVKSIRSQIPIPGKNAFGLEIPNTTRGIVGLKSMITSQAFQNPKHRLSFVLGQDCDGQNFVADLTKMPHLLIAGATGAGKSVALNALICSVLYKYSAEDVRFLLVDPKQVELNVYNGIPHMLIPNAVSDKDQTLRLLDWAIEEMELRYTLLSKQRLRSIDEYNAWARENGEQKLPYIVVIVDEVGDFMVVMKKDLEDRITRLTQKARAAGIILILATQRPSVDVITGIIKANLPARMAFAVSNDADSRTILGCGGAEKLLRDGDMIFSCTSVNPEPVRVQGPFISGSEVNAVCDYLRDNNDTYFDPEIEDFIMKKPTQANEANANFEGVDVDEKFVEVLYYVVSVGSVSITKIQRRFGFGFARAGKIVDAMEDMGFISQKNQKNEREVYITMEEFKEKYGAYEINITN